MKSYQTLYTECQTQSSDNDAGSLAFFKARLSEGIKKCYAVLNSEYFYATHTDATADGTESYKLPYNSARVHSLKVTISSKDYVVTEFPGDENAWLALTGGATSATESDYPAYYFVKADTYEIYPASSTDSYVMTMRYQVNPKDLSADDHTTDDIKTMVNGSTAVVGNTSTAFTAAMVGRYFKIDADGVWYKIASVTNGTNLVLAREYGGAAVTAGTESYTIGEMSYIPSAFQEAPIDYAMYRYYLQKEDSGKVAEYKAIWDEKLLDIKNYGASLTTSGVLVENVNIKNYNNYPMGLS